MTKAQGESNSIGFISVLKHAELGFFGGLLILNPHGRPLEFHCTLPLKPSRAQEILYGPTLSSFLCGELIGYALISKSKEEPVLILSDNRSVLSLRHLISIPIVFVENQDAESPTNNDLEETDSIDMEHFRLADQSVGIHRAYPMDRESTLKIWKSIGATIQLSEPFGRIQEALQEANPSTKAA